MTRRRYSRSLILLAAAIVFSAYTAGLHAFVKDALSMQPVAEEKLDAVVVLTGGTNRIDAGFDLIEKGFGKKLFISGVYRGNEISRLLKLWRSEPQDSLDCCVALGFSADNTVGNAVETVAWLKEQDYHSIYLVTSNYHIRRALLEFELSEPDLKIIPYPVAPGRLDIGVWWKDPPTRSLVLREYTKYIAAYAVHGLLHWR